MRLSKKTVGILKSFSQINTNLVVRPGSKLSTITPTKTVYAEATVDDKFDKQICIYNLNEFLGVVTAFSDPELELFDKHMIISEGINKVKYIYADENLLTLPPTKQIKLPSVEVQFNLMAESLERILKMAQILAVEDLSFIGDGKKIIARVLDTKNPTGNQFDVDLDTTTKDKFDIQIKVENVKLIPNNYAVEISKAKLAKFDNGDNVITYIAVEASSEFEV